MSRSRSKKRDWLQGEKPKTQKYFNRQIHKAERVLDKELVRNTETDQTGKPVLDPDDPNVGKRIHEIMTLARSDYACIAPYCGCEYDDYCDNECKYCHGPCERKF